MALILPHCLIELSLSLSLGYNRDFAEDLPIHLRIRYSLDERDGG